MTNHARRAMQERWRAMLIALLIEDKPLSPGRVYFIATGDNTGVASHKGRPALKAMCRRGWIEERRQPPYLAIRPGEDSTYSITDAGIEKLKQLGLDERACKVIRKGWDR